MRWRCLGWLMVPALIFTACSSVRSVQAGRETNLEMGILANPSDSHMWIISIDGRREGVASHGRYPLSPGRHVIRAQYYWTRGYVHWTGNDLVEYPFDVQKGDSLKILCEHAEEPVSGSGYGYAYKGTWRFWIEDATGRVVAADAAQPAMVRPATGEVQEPDYMLFPGMDR